MRLVWKCTPALLVHDQRLVAARAVFPHRRDFGEPRLAKGDPALASGHRVGDTRRQRAGGKHRG
jgi:hypothetical protein